MFLGADVASTNGRYRVVVAQYEPSRGERYCFEIYFKDSKGVWAKSATGNVPMLGHHGEFYISNDGSRLLLVDQYEGVWVYSSSGTQIACWSGNAITSMAKEVRVGKWACHPEGAWQSAGIRQVGDSFRTVVGTGTELTIKIGGSLQLNDRSNTSSQFIISASVIALAAGTALRLRR
jgi:hypothetical protein